MLINEIVKVKKTILYTKPSKPIIRLTIFKSAKTRFIRQDVPQYMSLKIVLEIICGIYQTTYFHTCASSHKNRKFPLILAYPSIPYHILSYPIISHHISYHIISYLIISQHIQSVVCLLRFRYYRPPTTFEKCHGTGVFYDS